MFNATPEASCEVGLIVCIIYSTALDSYSFAARTAKAIYPHWCERIKCEGHQIILTPNVSRFFRTNILLYG
jgi:hypothetical protein